MMKWICDFDSYFLHNILCWECNNMVKFRDRVMPIAHVLSQF